MPEPKNLIPKPGRRLLSPPLPQVSPETKQRSMMVIALTLLLVALVFVLYRDRDFWFPGTQEAQDSQPEAAATTTAASQPVPSVAKIPPPLAAFKPRRHRSAAAKPKSPDIRSGRTVHTPGRRHLQNGPTSSRSGSCRGKCPSRASPQHQFRASGSTAGLGSAGGPRTSGR